MESNNPRRRFLNKMSVLGLGTLIPFPGNLKAMEFTADIPTACTIIPSETRGPFPLFDSSAISSQSALIRSDIRETQAGVPLVLTMNIQNLACTPLAGLKVYIWHCSQDGLYSGYSNGMNPGQAGLTYLRGIQTTNADGQVIFTTVYPGWYNGRLTHIHCEVYAANVLLRTSQYAFPLDSVAGSPTALVNASYSNTNNPITNYSGDNVFNNGYTEQLLSPVGSVVAGYTANHTFTVDFTPIPLHLVSFTAGVENRNPMLWWITENELNVSRFEIEQSTHPSRDYQTVGIINAFNSSSVNNYSFSLQQPLPAAITYFRLKITDKDGSFTYSAVVTLHSDTIETFSLVNSYATSELIIKHPSVYSNSVIKIVNMNGQLVGTGKLKTGVSLTSINIKQFNKGIYLLIIESGIDRFVTKFYKADQ